MGAALLGSTAAADTYTLIECKWKRARAKAFELCPDTYTLIECKSGEVKEWKHIGWYQILIL